MDNVDKILQLSYETKKSAINTLSELNEQQEILQNIDNKNNSIIATLLDKSNNIIDSIKSIFFRHRPINKEKYTHTNSQKIPPRNPFPITNPIQNTNISKITSPNQNTNDKLDSIISNVRDIIEINKIMNNELVEQDSLFESILENINNNKYKINNINDKLCSL
jgi:hypothetical protein